MLFPTLAILATLHSASAFFVGIQPLVSSRMDPIVNPGGISGHTHQIHGANNFRSVLNSPDELLKADCTTASISVDKSNYWVPMIYFINDEGKYEPLMSNGGRAYYFTRSDKTQPFPPGFRMLAGEAGSRDIYRPQMASHALGYTCDQQNTDDNRAYLPNATSYPGGCKQVMLTVTFPSCGWANQSLDSSDHQAHITYPIDVGGGVSWLNPFAGTNCPPSHPIKYPNMHLEIYFMLSDRQKSMWSSSGTVNRLILATGDTLGTTSHGDYVFGWETDPFKQAITQCLTEDDAGDCGPLKQYFDVTKARNCRFAGMIPDEDVGYGGALSDLPGCNARWDLSAGDDKPKNCNQGVTPGWTAPNAIFQTAARYPVPVAIDFGSTAISAYDHSAWGDEAYFEPYDNQTFCCGAVAPNLGRWNTGTAADIADNKDASTAKNKIDSVFGQSDSSAFDTWAPGAVVAAADYDINEGLPSTNWHPNGIAPSPPPDAWFATVGVLQGGDGSQANGSAGGGGGGADVVTSAAAPASTGSANDTGGSIAPMAAATGDMSAASATAGSSGSDTAAPTASASVPGKGLAAVPDPSAVDSTAPANSSGPATGAASADLGAATDASSPGASTANGTDPVATPGVATPGVADNSTNGTSGVASNNTAAVPGYAGNSTAAGNGTAAAAALPTPTKKKCMRRRSRIHGNI